MFSQRRSKAEFASGGQRLRCCSPLAPSRASVLRTPATDPDSCLATPGDTRTAKTVQGRLAPGAVQRRRAQHALA
jgi:hypothetical protein